MALTIGTDAGFVETAPTETPTAVSSDTIQGDAFRISDTSSATAGKVKEIGWYCSTATEEANFEVAIYDGNTLLAGSSQTNAKGTGIGWKVATGLDITISPNTEYFIAVQLDTTATATRSLQEAGHTGFGWNKDSPSSTLPSPWSTTGGGNNSTMSFYAVWEAGAAGTNMQANIGDAWKAIPLMKINIGDTWKTVEGMQINIGDAWKTIF